MSNFPTSQPGAKTDFDSNTAVASSLQNAQGEDINAIAVKVGHGTDDNTPTENKLLRGTGAGTSEWDFDIKDEDEMTSNSATAVPTQQSTKAYVDTHAADTSTHGVSEVADAADLTTHAADTSTHGVAEVANAGDLTTHISDTTTHGATGAVVGTTNEQTLTNKTTIQKVTSYTPTGGATATLNLTTGNIHKITMPAGNITIAISNEATGQCFLVEITQAGSRTVTWFSTIKWAGGSAPTLTTTASKRDTFGFRVTSTDHYDGYIVGQNI